MLIKQLAILFDLYFSRLPLENYLLRIGTREIGLILRWALLTIVEIMVLLALFRFIHTIACFFNLSFTLRVEFETDDVVGKKYAVSSFIETF